VAGDHPQEDPRLKNVRYLTFDCYGTLIDWKRGIEAALGAALGGAPRVKGGLLAAYLEAEKEEERSYKKYRQVLRNAALQVASRAGVDLGEEEAEAFADSLPSWPAFSDARPSLDELRSRGYELYVLSNVDRDLLEETIRRSRLELDGYVTADDTGSYKPAPGHWETFMKRSGAEREGILHVAQSVFHDIMPAQKMGISSAWVNRYHERLPPGAQPSFIVGGLEDLLPLLPRRAQA